MTLGLLFNANNAQFSNRSDIFHFHSTLIFYTTDSWQTTRGEFGGEDGKYKIEPGVVFYTRSARSKIVYKRGVEWWLIDLDDVVKDLEKPIEEKVTESRVLYYFKGLQ